MYNVWPCRFIHCRDEQNRFFIKVGQYCACTRRPMYTCLVGMRKIDLPLHYVVVETGYASVIMCRALVMSPMFPRCSHRSDQVMREEGHWCPGTVQIGHVDTSLLCVVCLCLRQHCYLSSPVGHF